MYIYNWRYDGNERWDSTDSSSREGVERRAYFELVNALSEDRFRPLAPVVGEAAAGAAAGAGPAAAAAAGGSQPPSAGG